MTVDVSAPIYPLCLAGLHAMTPDNSKPHHDRITCRGCDTARRKEREERIKARMRMLLAGFAYWPRGDWQKQAACRDAPPVLFQCADRSDETPTTSADMVNRERHAEARDYCEVCPVVAQCLGQALMLGDHGTRGGELLTPNDWKSARGIKKELGL